MSSCYVGDWEHLIRFDSYDRMRVFLDNEPRFHRVYLNESRYYPQFKLVSDTDFVDELVVDSRGYVVSFFQITYWGAYRGMKRYSSGGFQLIKG